MGNVKFLKIVIFTLALLNVATLTFIWMHRRPGPPPELLIQKLDLDKNQQAQFEQLRETHRNAMRILRESNNQLRQKLYANLSADSSQYNILADSILLTQKEMERITFDHFKGVRALCRPDQQEKFDGFIGEAVQGMLQGQRQRPRRGEKE